MTFAASVPVDPDRATGRRWLADELAEPVYDAAEPGLLERAVTWLWERLSDLEIPEGPGGGIGLALLALGVLLVVAVVVARVGPARRAARVRTGEVFADAVHSADAHRSSADSHAALGEWDLAVRERFRAVVRSLEERTVLDPRPGRTADEAAREAATALPGLAADLVRGALVFDDVWYGGRPATAAHDATLRALDAAVGGARPVLVAP
ncbi:MAG TPA: DUF4129 domain-containing protein [Actinomycetales bacterium]|nr:DUF4129 domain-containing protein [Actinomycetales bacterium]